MEFGFLLVMFLAGHALVASDTDRDSSPDARIFRTLSRPAIENLLVLPSDSELSGSHSDQSSDEISIPRHLSSLIGLSSVTSSSGSSSYSDSDHEKCAISDNDLIQVEKLIALIATCPAFEKKVYGLLDLHRFRFDPVQGKTLGDMLEGLLERQMTLRVDTNAHTLTFQCIRDENQEQMYSLRRTLDELKNKMIHQDESIQEIVLVLRDLQSCVIDFQKEMKGFISLMIVRESLKNDICLSNDTSERDLK